MREIKFRAWLSAQTDDPTEGTMYSPDDVQWVGQGEANCDGDVLAIGDDLTIEQFTGLKDKNGREIYEGDIWAVATGASVINGIKTIHYNKGDVSIHMDGIYIGTLPLWANSHIFGNGIGEVIGNIHENPELLK